MYCNLASCTCCPSYCLSSNRVARCAGGKYTFHGISQPSVSFGANAIKTSAKGYRRLSFADGGCIEIDYPTYMMRGIVYTAMPRGDCTGTARFTDQQNRLSCNVDFGKIEGAVNPLLQRPDSFQGIIYSHDEALPASCSPDTQTVRLLICRVKAAHGTGLCFQARKQCSQSGEEHLPPQPGCRQG